MDFKNAVRWPPHRADCERQEGWRRNVSPVCLQPRRSVSIVSRRVVLVAEGAEIEGHTGGVGLGLAAVRSIVRAHGGEVTLTNRADGGLQAFVTLPKD